MWEVDIICVTWQTRFKQSSGVQKLAKFFHFGFVQFVGQLKVVWFWNLSHQKRYQKSYLLIVSAFWYLKNGETRAKKNICCFFCAQHGTRNNIKFDSPSHFDSHIHPFHLAYADFAVIFVFFVFLSEKKSGNPKKLRELFLSYIIVDHFYIWVNETKNFCK